MWHRERFMSCQRRSDPGLRAYYRKTPHTSLAIYLFIDWNTLPKRWKKLSNLQFSRRLVVSRRDWSKFCFKPLLPSITIGNQKVLLSCAILRNSCPRIRCKAWPRKETEEYLWTHYPYKSRLPSVQATLALKFLRSLMQLGLFHYSEKLPANLWFAGIAKWSSSRE